VKLTIEISDTAFIVWGFPAIKHSGKKQFPRHLNIPLIVPRTPMTYCAFSNAERLNLNQTDQFDILIL
jgi:hypothetical protein